ncbi:hypothetical protein D3C76_1350890 [compost metagenome]
MAELCAQLFEDNALFFAVRREIHVAAFAWQADPALVDVYQMRDAKTGAGTVNGDRLTFHRLGTAELDQMFRF